MKKNKTQDVTSMFQIKKHEMVTPHNKINRSPRFKIVTKFDESDVIIDTYEKRNKISEIKLSPEKLKRFKERE